MARHTSEFQTVRSEGGLFPPDLLRLVISQEKDFPGNKPTDYGLPQGDRLNEAITLSWKRLTRHWTEFRKAVAQLPDDNAGQAVTNDKWTLPLLRELGFGLLPASAGPRIDGKDYPISRFAGQTPIHLLGFRTDLDKRTAGQRGAASGNPHGLVQEFLNRSEGHLWGIVSNGLRFRLLRDNQALSRQSYLEFDLETMFNGEVYSDFVLLWMVAHATRFAVPDGAEVGECYLERWTKLAEEQGTRALKELRSGVEQALQALGQGFVSHPKNETLRIALRTGALRKEDLHAQLLRVIYRLIFLFVAEDRTLEGVPIIHPPDESDASRLARDRYAKYYSARRLRQLSNSIKGSRHGDLWEQFNVVVGALSTDDRFATVRKELALPVLGSLLWDPASTTALNARSLSAGAGVSLANHDLLQAVRMLAFTQQNGQRRPVDYRNLGSEELGGVYEGLLALSPLISADGNRFSLPEFAGNERKSSGSYYTPDSLVQCVLDAALDPLIEHTLKGKNAVEAEKALLALKVCDPAVGSGHFLVGAAHRLAKHLARARALIQGESEPSPLLYQHALRDVIGHCLYGVDMNPMSAELCRVNLWLEALEPGKPLSFLDHHIRIGNSLLGTTPELVAGGIPDEAFKAIEGDDAGACAVLKKRNKAERKGLGPLFAAAQAEAQARLELAAATLDELPDERPEDIREKENRFHAYEETEDFRRKKKLYDAWCAAFFMKKRFAEPGNERSAFGVTQGVLNDFVSGEALPPVLNAEVDELTTEYKFFHWHLAFPEVFAHGGFDAMLGNPPWERVKLQEEEFFSSRAPEIANAKNANARKAMIAELRRSNPVLADEWESATRTAQAESAFMRLSGRYPLGGVGDVNTYAVFADLFWQCINMTGASGLILQDGLVTGFTYRRFLQEMLSTNRLAAFYGFENEDRIFPDVHNEKKFGILVVHGTSRPVERPWLTANVRQPEQVKDPRYRYSLSAAEIEAINPNTLNLPAFRLASDAEVMAQIHLSATILKKRLDDGTIVCPWEVELKSMFHMAGASGHFIDHEDVRDNIISYSGTMAQLRDGSWIYPLYEGKMCWHYDHRYGTYEGQTEKQANKGVLPHVSDDHHNNPSYRIEPRYWITPDKVEEKLGQYAGLRYYFSWRDVGPTERTFVGCLVPKTAAGDTAFALLTNHSAVHVAALTAVLSSLVVDYDARQNSNRMKFFVVEQLAVLTPDQITEERQWLDQNAESWFARRVLELSYTNVELEPFARDLGFQGPPFRWQPARRAHLQAEIDAAVMHLYKLSREQAEWIIDSFTVLRKYEEADHGEFRTKRMVMEIYDAMAEAMKEGRAYQSPLDPPVADERCCHPVAAIS